MVLWLLSDGCMRVLLISGIIRNGMELVANTRAHRGGGSHRRHPLFIHSCRLYVLQHFTTLEHANNPLTYVFIGRYIAVTHFSTFSCCCRLGETETACFLCAVTVARVAADHRACVRCVSQRVQKLHQRRGEGFFPAGVGEAVRLV